ncbi:MAG: hypothetical protein NC339_06280 [Muribaculaceae bacterium]|nr:hypothetical protein [Muribaculaceae bacterium]
MERIYLTNSNIRTILTSGEAAYLIIEEPLYPSGGKISFPTGSVLDFQGGSLAPYSRDGSLEVELNGSEVVAPPCCIFHKGTNVTGFSNTLVHAEWFNDLNAGMAEHEAINAAIVAAQGAPVTLECRTYNLEGTIVIPKLYGEPTQTLYCPGTLRLTKDIVAIKICAHYVNLRINKILGSPRPQGSSPNAFVGTGILFNGNNYHCDVDVFNLQNLHKGIDFTADNGSGIQYCRVKFQQITADYCMYMNNVTVDEKGNQHIGWFTESLIIGGVMSGGNGIYCEYTVPDDTWPMDGLVFLNIVFQNLSGLAMKLNDLHASNFHNIKFGSGLPSRSNDYWVDFEYTKHLNIWCEGQVHPGRLNVPTDKVSEGQYINVYGIMASSDGTRYDWLDTLSTVRVLENKNEFKDGVFKVLTSSVPPYNMGKVIMTSQSSGSGVLHLKDLLPSANLGTNGADNVDVIPQTLRVESSNNANTIIDLSGLRSFVPCITNLYVSLSSGGKITLKTSSNPSWMVMSNDRQNKFKEKTFTTGGFFRLTWDLDYNIIISFSN